MYTTGFGAQDGVEPGHTPRPRGRPKVRMLLSFQRPSHLFWKGGSFPRGALPGTGIGSGPRGGPASIAPEMASEEGWRGKFRGPATLLDCRWGPCGGPKERGAASEGTRAPRLSL